MLKLHPSSNILGTNEFILSIVASSKQVKIVLGAGNPLSVKNPSSTY